MTRQLLEGQQQTNMLLRELLARSNQPTAMAYTPTMMQPFMAPLAIGGAGINPQPPAAPQPPATTTHVPAPAVPQNASGSTNSANCDGPLSTGTVTCSELWEEWMTGCKVVDENGAERHKDAVITMLASGKTVYPIFWEWKIAKKTYFHHRHVIIKEIQRRLPNNQLSGGATIARALDEERGSLGFKKFAAKLMAARKASPA